MNKKRTPLDVCLDIVVSRVLQQKMIYDHWTRAGYVN